MTEESASWKDSLLETLVRHLAFLDEIFNYSFKINNFLKEKKEGDLALEIENRRRLISISMIFQKKIHLFIKENKREISKNEDEIKDIILLWEKDTKKTLKTVKSIDLNSMALLEQNKAETTKEIATVFNSHNKLKGYDLSSVK